MTPQEREFDIVVWGATGFTGRLVAEYLLERYGASPAFRWALGGRSPSKLEEVRQGLGPDARELPVVVGDADDAASMASLAGRTRVVCTTVGPYALYGSNLVAACARQGTHYCDLTGEVHWMRRMIDAHQDQAAGSGARLVPTCGFDCIPSDLGTYFVQREMQARHGVPAKRVRMRVVGFSGAASGGTVASMLNMMEEQKKDPEIRRLMREPYALNPKDRQSGRDGPERMTPAYDAELGQWTAPFVMGGVDTKVVRRTNALLDDRYGREFRYDEAMLMGAGPVGFAKAAAFAAGLGAGMGAAAVLGVPEFVARRLPQPGEGPSKAQREAGYFEIVLVAEHPDDPAKNLRARVEGDRDPGYGSTAKMLGESAVCLAQDPLSVGGGFWTPASAMGDPLLERLPKNAGVRFAIEEG